MQPVIVDGRVTLVFDALSAVGLVVVCAVVLGVGLVARRYLWTMGDLPQMPALRWGARWFGPLVVGTLAVYAVALYVGVTHTSYPFTVLALGRFGIIVIILLPLLLLPTQADGWLLGLLVMLDAVRFTSRDYRAWVERRVASGGRRAYEWLILLALLLGPMAAAAGVARNSYLADRETQRVRHATMVEEAVRAVAAHLPVVEVTAMPTAEERFVVRVLARPDLPNDALQRISDRIAAALPVVAGGPDRWTLTVLTRDRKVEESVRASLVGEAVREVTATRALGGDPSAVTITLSGAADEPRAQAIGRKVERILRRLGLDAGWQIRVRPGEGPEATRELHLNLGAGSVAAP